MKVVAPGHFKTGFISRSLLLARHGEYDAQFRNYMEWVHEENRKAPGPEPVARVILQAADAHCSELA